MISVVGRWLLVIFLYILTIRNAKLTQITPQIKRAIMFFPKMPSYDQIQEVENFIKTAKSGKKKSLLGVTFRVYGENVFVEK